VGANKNSVKIIGAHTNLYAQAYFMYDSRKSGGITVSHLRFGKTPIRSTYLIDEANFVACHNPSYLTRYDMLSELKTDGVFLLNCPWQTLEELEEKLPYPVKNILAKKQARFYTLDGTKIANELGLKGRNSTIMQAAFFLLNPTIMPYETAKTLLKAELKKKFSKKGEKIVEMNCAAVDKAEEFLKEIHYPNSWATTTGGKPPLARPKNEYFQEFMLPILSLKGDELPVSAFSTDGSVPTGTSKLEKHGVAFEIPQWIEENCIQCNQCSFSCPHACIRPFILDETQKKPNGFTTKPAIGLPNKQYRIQVAAHDCMGCGVCAHVCPAKNKALVMRPATQLLPQEGKNWEFATTLPQANTQTFKRNTVKGSQFHPPLFEFSYACAGCGETPYIKLLTQLFGEKMIIANATGCSSIYGGSSPSCPYTKNEHGQGPAWANSLFEDNAEFGLGMRLAIDSQKSENERSIWIIGGDGWAYDIGYGGLDHVLASGENVNILVLDSEVYSNTGGQKSKATPMGATARFAMSGKHTAKKNLGLMAMTYRTAYVAQVSMGANKQQLINALTEAENYDGPSLVIAYSPCIAHGYPMNFSQEHEKLAVDCGYWNLYRFNPHLEKPFTLDSPNITADFKEFLQSENRFASLLRSNPTAAQALQTQAEKDSLARLEFYKKLAEIL
jgi:pyruvate-ferredoxin/flavodoxin oxidoreductase